MWDWAEMKSTECAFRNLDIVNKCLQYFLGGGWTPANAQQTVLAGAKLSHMYL